MSRIEPLAFEVSEVRAAVARIEAAQARLLLLLEPVAGRLREPQRVLARDWDSVQREGLEEFEEAMR